MTDVRNSCTCPDYQTNLIGTCKHIEGVLIHLREEYSPRLKTLAQQKAWFIDQVKRGQRTFDVLSTKLYRYQPEGAMHFAFGRRALLADDMGLGKTIQAIAASALLKDLRGIERALIVCPASLKHQWAREIKRFTSLPVIVVEGGLMARREAYHTPAFFKIINYEIVRRDLPDLQQIRSDLIILDEAQRIKNWRAKTADMVKQLRSRYAFALTGTPLENRLDEAYSIFQFLDPRILGPLWNFNDRFFQVEERDNGTYKVLGYKNLDELRTTIGPYVLRSPRRERWINWCLAWNVARSLQLCCASR